MFVLLFSLYKKYICCVSFYVHVFVFLQLKSYEIFATGRWFSLDAPVYSTNKTDRHDITEILLKVALNTITLST